MDCPKCKSNKHVKDGIVGGRQRRKCKDCQYRYTVERRSNEKTPVTKRLALELYLEGLAFRSIGKILKISYATVFLWVKEWGAQTSLPRNETTAQMAELDSMIDYISSKKTASEHGLLLVDLDKNVSILSVGSIVDEVKI